MRQPSWGVMVPMGWGMGMMGWSMGMMGWGGRAAAWGTPWMFTSAPGGTRAASGRPSQDVGLRAQLRATLDQMNQLLKALVQRLLALGGGG